MLFLLWILTLASAVAQQPPKPPNPPPPPKPSPAPSAPGQPSGRPQQVQRILFLTGTVVMSDGSPVPGRFSVELNCNGSGVHRASIGPSGQFSFELGGNRPEVMADASYSGWPGGTASANDSLGGFGSGISDAGLGRIDLNSCQIRLPLEPGFHSNPIQLSTRSVFDNPDVGTLLVHRLDGSQGTTISVQSLAAPGNARKSFQRATKELAKRKPRSEKAVQELEKAIALFPTFAEAWNLLGRVRLQSEDEEGAREAFSRAIEADKKFVLPYLNMAQLEINKGRWQEAAEWTRTLIELNPYIDDSHYLNGLANYYLGSFDAAQTSFLKVQENRNSTFLVKSYFFTGLIFAQKGLVPESAADLRRFLRSAPAGSIPDDLRTRITSQLGEWERQGLIDPDPGAHP